MVQTNKTNLEQKRGQPRRRVRTLWRSSVFITVILTLFCGGIGYAIWRVWHKDWVFETVKKFEKSLILNAADGVVGVRMTSTPSLKTCKKSF